MSFQTRIPLCVIIVLTSCATPEKKKDDLHFSFAQYSESVKDTFYIDVQLPKEYHTTPGKQYPTLLFIDGNFYFPMMSSIMCQYEMAGLLEPFIVVGIGYKSFKTMDSLRVRDYLFPKALPSDEIHADGGGLNFYKYITKELLPEIDTTFKTNKTDRTLLGHSFGGYFVLYTLLLESVNQTDNFKNFISASPTLWYNDFYLNKLPDQLATHKSEKALFMSVGALEDSTWSVHPVKSLAMKLQNKRIKGFDFKSRIFNHLEHMDVALLTFTKGIQEQRRSK